MDNAHLIEAAERLLSAIPHENPAHCRDLAKAAREVNLVELAERLDRATCSPPSWPGASIVGDPG